MILKITPNACVTWKKICKLGLTPEFGLITKSDLLFSTHPLYTVYCHLFHLANKLFACFLYYPTHIFVFIFILHVVTNAPPKPHSAVFDSTAWRAVNRLHSSVNTAWQSNLDCSRLADDENHIKRQNGNDSTNGTVKRKTRWPTAAHIKETEGKLSQVAENESHTICLAAVDFSVLFCRLDEPRIS